MYKFLALLIVGVALGCSAFGQDPEPAAKVGVAEFYLAKDDGKGQAGEQVSGFSTTDVPIYCVVQLDSFVPATVKMNLVVVAVPGMKSGTSVVSTSYTTKDNQNRVNFAGRPSGEWPAGRYRADIYVGSTLAVSREFAVQGPVLPKPSVEGINVPKPGNKPKSVRRPRGGT